MTTWSPSGVVQYVTKAGWKGDAITDAVAVALAASNGADHFRFNPGHLDATERQGLFALTRAEHLLGPDADLFNPETASLAAYGLWKREGGHWRWHLAWASGAAAKQLDLVRQVLSNAHDHNTPIVPGSFEDSINSLLHRTEAMRQAGMRVRQSHD